MRKKLRNSLAVLLVIALLTSLLSIGASATSADTHTETSAITTDQPELQGTNSVGTMLATALSEETAKQNTDCYISDLTFHGPEATVTYQAAVECDLVVGLYEEDGTKMLSSGTIAVKPTENTATVTFEAAEIPTYFVATAYLLDRESHAPLCDTYTTRNYTHEMQAFLTKTTDDFDQEKVLNLDDTKDTNFAVYKESTTITEQSADVNQLTDHGDGSYTIQNADSHFTTLQVGDVFSYQYDDGTTLIIKVKTITVDGTSVSITQDDDMELSDAFEYVKIESDGTDGEMTVDTQGLETGIQYEGEEVAPSTYAVDNEAKYSRSVAYSMDKTLGSDHVKLKGSFTYAFSIALKVYLAHDYQYISLGVDYSSAISIKVSGSLPECNIPTGRIEIVLLPGVLLGFQPVFQASFSAAIDWTGTIHGTIGMSYASDTGFVNKCTMPTCKSEVKIEGTFYIGFKQTFAVTIIHEELAEASVSAKEGVEIKAKKLLATTSASQKHDCSFCLDGTISAKLNCSGEAHLTRRIKKETTFGDLTVQLFRFYYSIDHNEFGWTTCPHILYRMKLAVKDASGTPLPNITVEGTNLDQAPVTDDSGIAVFYLANGNYTLTARNGDLSASKTITVQDQPKSFSMTLSEDSGNSEVVDPPITTPTVVDSGTCGDHLTWTLDDLGTLTISGSGDMDYWPGPINVPWIKSGHQFDIKKVNIEKGVTDIGIFSFDNCHSLNSITIPDSVTCIGARAFTYCISLPNITIPDSVTSIGSNAFAFCGMLTSITIPDSVTSIGNSAFRSTHLTSISVGAGNLNYSSRDGILFNKDMTTLICCPGGKSGTYTIPDSVTCIGESAFLDCTHLTSISIPNSVVSIRYNAFDNCNGLTSIVLPNSITSIFDRAFSECRSITSITIPNSVSSIGNNAFQYCDHLTNIYFKGDSPSFGSDVFYHVTATSYYPADNTTWTDDEKQNYGGTITWEPWNPDASDIQSDTGSSTPSTSAPADMPSQSREQQPFAPEDSSTEPDVSAGNITPASATFQHKDLSLDLFCGGTNGTTIPLKAFTGSNSTADGNQTATFTNLVPGEPYVLLVVKDEKAEFLLAADNLLYIAQTNADSNGTVSFTYLPRESMDSASIHAYGASDQTLSTALVTIPDLTYNGGAQNPEVTVLYDGSELEADTDYTLRGDISVMDAGTYSVTITGKNNYSGSVTASFQVKPQSLNTADVTLLATNYTYTGYAIKPLITVRCDATDLIENTDYTVSYQSNTNAGTAIATITGKGNYTGTITKEFTIQKADQTISASLSSSNIKVGETASITASAKTALSYHSSDTAIATVNSSGVITGKATGTATITVSAEATDNYTATSRELQITVIPSTKKLTDCTIALSKTSYTYDGTAKQPTVAAKDGGTALVQGTNYTVAYKNNINVGTATVTITGKGNYTGTVTKTFKITQADQVITAKSYTKTLGDKAFSLGAKTNGGGKLTYKSSNTKAATISSADKITIKGVGSAKITITAAATKNYKKATKSITITVNPTGTKLSSVTNLSGKKMKVTWKKNSKVTGYQIQYSTSSKFSGAKTVTVKSYKTTSSIISKLTKNKKYYVRIRTYQKVSGKTYYSAWSGSKNVTIKK